MGTYEWLIWLAGGATALIAIYKVAKKIVEWIRTTSKAIVDFNANIDRLIRHDKEQYFAILRLTIVSRDMPLSERITAGRKYTDDGGNGDVKQLYLELLKKCDEGST